MKMALHQAACFPLTLTLSLREREQPLIDFQKFVSHGAEAVLSITTETQCNFAEKLGAFLPLPKGEGWGEGERDRLISSAVNRH
jgi:hypothetical protein